MLNLSENILKFFVNLYQIIPFSGGIKFKIKSYIFRNFGFLCKSLPAYTQFKQIYGNAFLNKIKVPLKRKKNNILIIYTSLPMPDKDAGSISTEYIIKIMLDLGYSVSFFPLYFRNYIPQYTDYCRKLGVNVIDGSVAKNLNSYLRKEGNNYSFIYLIRYDIGKDCYKTVKKNAPHCKIIFFNMELAYLREKRQAHVTKSLLLRLKALQTKKTELNLIQKVDYTLVHTEFEKKMILHELRVGINEKNRIDDQIKIFPYIYNTEIGKPFDQREGIMFIGNYIHPPNYDAALFFLKEILPKIREKHPKIKCYIVGSNPTKEFFSYENEDTIITGFVEDAKEYFKKVKLTVVPLRFSSSVRGKIIISLSHGTPCVTTAVGAEGMGLTHGKNIFVADDIELFTQYVLKLYQDYHLWQNVSDDGMHFIKKHHSYDTGKSIISAIIT